MLHRVPGGHARRRPMVRGSKGKRLDIAPVGFEGVLSDDERELAARLRPTQEQLPHTRAGEALRAILERMGGAPG